MPRTSEISGCRRCISRRRCSARAPWVRDFVENQQGAVAVASVADDAVILRRRDLHVGRAYGLDDDRADILFLAEDIVEVFGAAQVAGVAAAKPTLAGIAGLRVLVTRQ